MTTDPFTEAARTEATSRARRVTPGDTAADWSERMLMMEQFRQGAEWARTHLAAQETDGERAVRELHEPILAYRLIDGEDFAQEPDGDVCVVCREYYPCDTVQALDSARAARRDEEKR